jgi:hypothetical protein
MQGNTVQFLSLLLACNDRSVINEYEDQLIYTKWQRTRENTLTPLKRCTYSTVRKNDTRFEVLTAVKTSCVVLVFWAVALCGLEGIYQRLGGTCFVPEDGGSKFLRNVGINLQLQTVLQPQKTNTQKKCLP